MERLSGLYKRWAQTWSFIIAFIIAIAFNVDTIQIAGELWNNPALRQASTVYIEKFVEEKTQDDASLEDTDLQELKVDLQELNFPVGWDEVPERKYLDIKTPSSWSFLWPKLIGWLITAGAAMQGAPFWFDTLKKLVNIRSSGTNPIEKPKEDNK